MRFGILSNPRSGTSLLLKLIWQSFDTSKWDSFCPECLQDDIYKYRVLPSTVFNFPMKGNKLLNINRDPRDVILSKHPSVGREIVSFDSWVDNQKSIQDLETHGFSIFRLSFEELLINPDGCQDAIEGYLGQKRVKYFSEIFEKPLTKGLRIMDLQGEMGGPRPPDISVIGKWKTSEHFNEIQRQVEDDKELRARINFLGYF